MVGRIIKIAYYFKDDLRDYLHVLKGSVVDHEGHSIYLKIVELISFQ